MLRSAPSELKGALEKYIGKLASGIVEANILFAVNFMFKANATMEDLEKEENDFSPGSCD